MRLVLAALLLACACATVPRATAPARWSPELQKSVFVQCYAAKPSPSFCSCYAFALEQLSPDPETEFTDSDFARARSVCESGPLEEGRLTL